MGSVICEHFFSFVVFRSTHDLSALKVFDRIFMKYAYVKVNLVSHSVVAAF